MESSIQQERKGTQILVSTFLPAEQEVCPDMVDSALIPLLSKSFSIPKERICARLRGSLPSSIVFRVEHSEETSKRVKFSFETRFEDDIAHKV
jgi:hypothetical protein